MGLITNLYQTFSVTSDADLSSDTGFYRPFATIVNITFLIQSLFLGIYSLFIENALLSSTNLLFCLFFVCYLFASFLHYYSDTVTTVDRVVIFTYSLVIHGTSHYLGITSLPITLYPFIAILLHGRHAGVAITVLNLLLLLASYGIYGSASETMDAKELFEKCIYITLVQIACTAVYFISIRWLSTMIYDKNRELAILSDEIRVKDDLVSRLTAGVDKPISEINDALNILSGERLAPIQSELIGLIRASTTNATSNIEAVKKAASHNIPVIPNEETQFNIYTLLSGLLKLFKCKDPTKKHSFALASNVPETLLGNSMLTRQVLLNVFDALENKIGLAEYNFKVYVSRDDVFDQGVVLHYHLLLEHHIRLDRRVVSSSQSRLVDFLELMVTKNIVESEGCSFGILTNNEGLHIEFSLRYKDAEHVSSDVDLQDGVRYELDRTMPLHNCEVLVLTDDDTVYAKAWNSINGIVSGIKRVRTFDEALNVFVNSKIDMVLADISKDFEGGLKLIRDIRGAESGIANRIPTVAYLAPSEDTVAEMRCIEAGYDMTFPLPYDVELSRAAVCSYFV
ncbi:MAG: hypothetical protein II951_00585 [Bacteroidales bacterium]|nr:hypothetical protein [Bacteroidales bacterium]